jgi:large subunit ribosomal protein L3
MVNGIIGKKLGMTQLFLEDGSVTPVTVIKAGPCIVVQKKTVNTDGYDAVQLGLVEDKAPRHVNKPTEGHFKRAGVPPTRVLREVRIQASDEATTVGDKILVDMFNENDVVEVIGKSKGKGFAGVVKRHGFAGGVATHGSMFHRAPGGIGASAYPSRVIKGTKMPGHMGNVRITVKNLRVAAVDTENNLLMIRGAVPGPNGSYVLIKKAQL